LIYENLGFPLLFGIPTDVDSTSTLADQEPFSHYSSATVNIIPDPPAFPLPIEIPNYYLYEVLQIQGGQDDQGTTIGIATSNFNDAGILYYRVHLPTGAIFTINSGFVKILQQNEEDIDTSEEERDHNIDREEHELHGRPSSCEDPISTCSEEEED
jgi:hypothetical protein